ncbi:LuxR C-terminal-related transcriptional regulator [Buttiauxella sp. WJP83]|uniref:helix-turn-helix transcriptional regulator n=1 Tax=Buttiauxella sp. WJP83 TaxID=2986951 RepID=UPI0022DE835C|nr:LuxR C-terminal-related transcriptional regulator [Buttiauxella sp. WJP83]WBM69654.1 LuxR C-terminal-related transcriptional regulator [Buttiauxella sp. WJP83]
MIKIIVDSDDGFYRLGIHTLLSKIFLEQFNENISLINGINKKNVAQADVIIMGLLPGECFVCHPTLYARKKNSLLIGIYKGAQKSQFDDLPLCFGNIILINRHESITRIAKKISYGWECCREEFLDFGPWSCQDCGHKTLSPQQVKVASHYFEGVSVQQIAQILSINSKTVFAHKRMIMSKFNVHTDYELLSLLNVMKKLKNNAPDFLVNHME